MPSSVLLLTTSLALLTSSFARPNSLLASKDSNSNSSAAACNTYTISGITGGFTGKILADFSTATSGGDAAAFLSYVYNPPASFLV